MNHNDLNGTTVTHHAAQVIDARPDRSSRRAARLEAARLFIEANLSSQNLSPACAARALGISVRLLHLVFKASGTSFSRYVTTRRLERARRELLVPGRKVLDVAYSCGLESSTFYRAFRATYGTTPNAHRRSAGKTRQTEEAPYRPPGEAAPRRDELTAGEAAPSANTDSLEWRPHGESNPGLHRERVMS